MIPGSQHLQHSGHCIREYRKLIIQIESYISLKCEHLLRYWILLFLFRRIRSSINDNSFSPSTSNGTNRRTRIVRVIQEFQTKLGSKIQKVKKNLPMKLLFFLAGFYCATAFSTVIGQTGDWDILSAALAVVVVEGIGALMYSSFLPLITKRLISVFNYWKAGLTLGLFLDSFKYWFDFILDIAVK